MEAELAALTSSGATTLVGLMVSDAWAQARGRMARFFGGGGGSADASAEELDVSREELVAALAAGDEEAAADIEAAWRSRLRRALRADPAAAGELRTILDELVPLAAAGTVTVVNNSVSFGVHYGLSVQGQNFSAPLNFHAAPPEPRPLPDGDAPQGS